MELNQREAAETNVGLEKSDTEILEQLARQVQEIAVYIRSHRNLEANDLSQDLFIEGAKSHRDWGCVPAWVVKSSRQEHRRYAKSSRARRTGCVQTCCWSGSVSNGC